MKIPRTIILKQKLPHVPGVYVMSNARGEIIYIGKASSLRSRVMAYWGTQEARNRPQVSGLMREVASLEIMETGSVIEALILEANLIKKYEPKYNIMQKDDKSFLYLVITRDQFPRPLLVRGNELSKVGEREYRQVFGPYTSPGALRAALKLMRKIFPWSTCLPPSAIIVRKRLPAGRQGATKRSRPCFDYHLRLCPGVCVGAVSRREYVKTIRGLVLFFQGEKSRILRGLRRDMQRFAAAEQFEKAEAARRKLFALEHIQDVAILTREESPYFGKPKREEPVINIFGRIEGYDISNLSGTSAVGSMVVFHDGEPAKSQYRKFKINTVRAANDYAMLAEVLRRRFGNAWPRPDLILIDGGLGQVNVAWQILMEKKLTIPIIGIAKGFDRKQDRLVHDQKNLELARIAEQYKQLLQRVRDEAHRFAIGYHRQMRGSRRL